MFLPNPRIIFLIISMSPIFLPLVNPLNFNFPGFNETAEININRRGDTFFNNQVISLTKNDLTISITGSVGRAVHKDRFPLWDSKSRKMANFSTHFSFSINSLSHSSTGDGLTFFLMSDSSILSDDSGDGFLGIYTTNSTLNTTVYSFVAVEIDTFKNDWDSSPADHLGINIDSFASAVNVPLNSSFKDGQTVNASVSYHSITKNLSVLLAYDDGQLASLWHVVDLSVFLPETVNIGFSASTGIRTETHKILSWNFTSDLVEMETPESRIELREPTAKSTFMIHVRYFVAMVVMVTVLGVSLFMLWRKKANRLAVLGEANTDESIDHDIEKEGGPKRFTTIELFAATKNFAIEGKLGRGGFGEVYKGLLNNEEVAIKKVFARSEQQGKKEYFAEVRVISRLRHRNLVQLVGWCHKKEEFLLVYKFMPNGSLDTHLHSQERFLAWPLRYKIALGLASALLYLHEEWEQCVVHRDIKPSNVMLDSDFEAKLGDFGLARFVDHEIGSQTTILAGTMGYLAPESVTTGKARKESDVYSFGIVALEIACGRRPVEPREELGKVLLVEWVWELYGRHTILEAADKRLKMDFEEKEIIQLMVVGLWCVHPDHKLRPSIRQVINVLNFESPLPLLPPSIPVPTYNAFPMDIFNTSSLEGYEDFAMISSSMTNSSGSPSTSLLKSYEIGM